MPRPCKKRLVRFNPKVRYFKPRGVALSELEEVTLMREEVEAIKLYDLDGLDQTTAAERMRISQSTFQRILKSANRKVAMGLINGLALRIEE